MRRPMRQCVPAAVIAAALAIAIPRAEARDMNGRLGIGAQRTLAGVTGFDVVYWVGTLELEGTVRIIFAAPDAGDSALDFRLAAGAFFPFLRGEQAELAVGGRVNLAVDGGDQGGNQIALEAPLRLTWYVTSHLALHGEVGVVLEIIPAEGRVVAPSPAPPDGKGTGFLVGATALSGGAGFTFIF